MPPLLEDPRIRQTWNQISHNAESATENAAANIWGFTHSYISPCLSSISSSFEQCTGTCFPDREERARRLRERGRGRGRAEYSFDFYDDWDEEEEGRGTSGGILGWGNDELDRLLAGSGTHEQPSGRKRGMSYGTRASGRRKTIDGRPDPTIIPSTNPLGFLGRLPFKIGTTLRYKPSAADLQEHPGRLSSDVAHIEEAEPLIDEGSNEEIILKSPTRKRSSTASSGETTDSYRSRGDLFPSDEEDAVPLDDEFAMVLERRNTAVSGTDDRSSGRTRSSKGKKPAGPRRISVTPSSKTLDSNHQSIRRGKDDSASSPYNLETSDTDSFGVPNAVQLQQEEERVKSEEEEMVERKRQAAAKLAIERGLHVQEDMIYKPELEIETEDLIKGGIADSTSPQVQPISNEPVSKESQAQEAPKDDFVPARLPHF